MNAEYRVDFHTHTRYSSDSLTEVSQLVQTARKKGLGKIAVTDHNALQGALEAFEIAPELVIVGEEIQTQRGEILGYFLNEIVPPGLSPLKTIERLREQNAFISIPHAFDPFRSRWVEEDLLELMPLIDAIEVFNARCFTRRMNDRAQKFAEQHGLAGTAGSDGHWYREIGNGVMVLPPFSNADELRKSIHHGRVIGKLTRFWARFYSSYVRLRRVLSNNT